MERKPPVKVGKVMTISLAEIPGPVEDLLNNLPEGGRLLTATERKLLATRLRRYGLDATGPVWVYRVVEMDAFRFTERPDLAGDEDTVAL